MIEAPYILKLVSSPPYYGMVHHAAQVHVHVHYKLQNKFTSNMHAGVTEFTANIMQNY